jgi:MtN3 and saliva related transmembrane protein
VKASSPRSVGIEEHHEAVVDLDDAVDEGGGRSGRGLQLVGADGEDLVDLVDDDAGGGLLGAQPQPQGQIADGDDLGLASADRRIRGRTLAGMSATTLLGVVAATFGVVMAAAPLLQAQQIRRRRSSADVSRSFLAIIVVGAALWAAYGLVLENWFIAVPNLLGVATNLLTLHLARRFMSV